MRKLVLVLSGLAAIGAVAAIASAATGGLPNIGTPRGCRASASLSVSPDSAGELTWRCQHTDSGLDTDTAKQGADD